VKNSDAAAQTSDNPGSGGGGDVCKTVILRCVCFEREEERNSNRTADEALS
jgi:hypothetical protein